VDISEYLVDLGRGWWPELDGRLHVGDAVNLHLFPDRYWHALHAAQVAEHWKPALVPHVLRELLRVSAPGASFFAIVETEESAAQRGAGTGPAPACLRPLAWWHARLREAGWEITSADFVQTLREHPGSFLNRYDWDWFVARRPSGDGATEAAVRESFEVQEARLVVGGAEVAPGAEFSLRWVDRPEVPALPVLYRGGKRVTRPWALDLSARRPADDGGANANTD
jgi:hypothetical protein